VNGGEWSPTPPGAEGDEGGGAAQCWWRASDGYWYPPQPAAAAPAPAAWPITAGDPAIPHPAADVAPTGGPGATPAVEPGTTWVLGGAYSDTGATGAPGGAYSDGAYSDTGGTGDGTMVAGSGAAWQIRPDATPAGDVGGYEGLPPGPPSQPPPSGSHNPFRSWPLWAKIAAPVGAFVLLMAAIASASGSEPEQTATSDREVTTTTVDDGPATTSTTAATTTSVAVTTTTALPPTTAPPTTVPPTTTPPPTAPPTTAAPAPSTTAAPLPQPPPEPAPPSGCDPNYSGCVPIASDVDCEGGSGDGPAYATGPVQVIGTDIYGLDSDNDGVGCED